MARTVSRYLVRVVVGREDCGHRADVLEKIAHQHPEAVCQQISGYPLAGDMTFSRTDGKYYRSSQLKPQTPLWTGPVHTGFV